jgi:hypothetical protein
MPAICAPLAKRECRVKAARAYGTVVITNHMDAAHHPWAAAAPPAGDRATPLGVRSHVGAAARPGAAFAHPLLSFHIQRQYPAVRKSIHTFLTFSVSQYYARAHAGVGPIAEVLCPKVSRPCGCSMLALPHESSNHGAAGKIILLSLSGAARDLRFERSGRGETATHGTDLPASDGKREDV